MKKIVFLNLAVMPYHVAVFKELVKIGYELHVFWYAKAPNTSYRTPQIENITLYNKFDYSTVNELTKKVNDISPVMVVCCGWTDKIYNKVALNLKKKRTPTVVISDTQWRGGKQWYNVLTSPFRIRRYFEYFFAAGILQYDYARKLGFPKDKIILHCLSGDTKLFNKVDIEKKKGKYPKRILYVGRFVDVKALDVLIEAWNKIKDKKSWILELVGEGPLKEKITENEHLIIKEFMPQEKLIIEAQESGCFILPSRFEPWALVIHEFAAAGMPLLCSKYCGAAKHFLINGYNGYEFDPNTIESLVDKLKKVISLDEETLIRMSVRSRELSNSITPEKTAHILVNIL